MDGISDFKYKKIKKIKKPENVKNFYEMETDWISFL
jgi:hypothetical protein